MLPFATNVADCQASGEIIELKERQGLYDTTDNQYFFLLFLYQIGR